MVRKLTLLGLFFSSSLTLWAENPQRQNFTRNSFWTETILNGKIQGKWRYQIDLQYRWMANNSTIGTGTSNLFAHPYQHVYRPWIHYQLNDNVRFSLSPIGFWETWTPSTESSTAKQRVQPELRICPQVTLTSKLGRVTFDQRYRYEYRIFGTTVNDEGGFFGYGQGNVYPSTTHKGRLRYFVRAIIPIGKHTKIEPKSFYVTTWNELFLGLGKNTNNDKIFDQNRTFLLLGYKPDMKFPMRFELGAGLQYANRVSSKFDAATNLLTESGHKFEANRILQLYVIFEDFNKLFSFNKPKK